jgi:hypothetical protein
MFFSISSSADPCFPNRHNHGFAFFNCDNGWTLNTTKCGTVYAKGYADSVPLTNLINHFDQASEYTGNFCLIRFSDTVEIKHSKTRSFPLRYNTQQVTNLYTGQDIWADSQVTIDQLWKISTSPLQLDLSVDQEYLTLDQAELAIFDLLTKQTQKFLTHCPVNLQLFVTGGLDTLLLYALLVNSKQSFTLLPVVDHYESDSFTDNAQDYLRKFWAYQQINHWNKPAWLATGSCGDEYLLRGPATIAMLTAWHDINFAELLQQNPNAYHYRHFSKYADLWMDTWNNRDQIKSQYPTRESLNRQILNILVNDHQHWHLGNTLTWTPFNNIDLVKILLRCDINELIPQFIDGRLSKNIISKIDNRLLTSLSQYKNYNRQENLSKLLEYHAKKFQ